MTPTMTRPGAALQIRVTGVAAPIALLPIIAQSESAQYVRALLGS